MLCALFCMNGRRSEGLPIRGIQPERAERRQLTPAPCSATDSVGRHGGQMNCRLGEKDKALQNSHVIPEFLYGPSYDEKHRIGVVSAGLPGMQSRSREFRSPSSAANVSSF